MLEPSSEPEQDVSFEDTLRSRLDHLERQTEEMRRQTEHRLVLSELKVEALRAGMVDLDGLQFLDTSQMRLGDDGNLIEGGEAIARLLQKKPWLFARPSSSSAARVPASKPVLQKLATEMSDEEYKSARAGIIRRSLS